MGYIQKYNHNCQCLCGVNTKLQDGFIRARISKPHIFQSAKSWLVLEATASVKVIKALVEL